jgi:hypothetical protein
LRVVGGRVEVIRGANVARELPHNGVRVA